MYKEKDFPFHAVPIIISTIASLTYLFYMVSTGRMDKMQGTIIGSTVAIVVALVGAAAGIWAQVVQFKRDSGKIDGVKVDTTEIRPSVQYIREDTTKIRDQMLEKVVPGMIAVSDINTNVAELIEDLNYQKRIKSQVTGATINSDYMIQSITSIYEENARLSTALNQERQKCRELLLRSQSLQSQLEQYQSRDQGQDQDR